MYGDRRIGQPDNLSCSYSVNSTKKLSETGSHTQTVCMCSFIPRKTEQMKFKMLILRFPFLDFDVVSLYVFF